MEDMVLLSGVWYKLAREIGFEVYIHPDAQPVNSYCSNDKNMYSSYRAEPPAGVSVTMTTIESMTKPEEKDQSKKL